MIQGAFTALVTPFDGKGKIDRPVYRSLLKCQAESGISGLVIGGTTGEGATLEHEELLDLIGIAVKEVGGRLQVIAGCGSNDTSKAVRLTREARDIGADAGLSVVPYYNKPPQEGLFEHFSAIATEGGLPIILYNVPGRTGSNLAPETVARLAHHPMIVGIKEASGNLQQIEDILANCPRDFSVLSGDDALTYAVMALGGHGVVSVTSNLFPRQVARMVVDMASMRWKEGMETHRFLSPVHRALFIDTNPIPVKAAFEILGFPVGSTRLPLAALDPAKREKLARLLHDYGEEFRKGRPVPASMPRG